MITWIHYTNYHVNPLNNLEDITQNHQVMPIYIYFEVKVDKANSKGYEV